MPRPTGGPSGFEAGLTIFGESFETDQFFCGRGTTIAQAHELRLFTQLSRIDEAPIRRTFTSMDRLRRRITPVLLPLSALFGCENSESSNLKPNTHVEPVEDSGCPHKEGGSCGTPPTAKPESQLSKDAHLYGKPLETEHRVQLRELLKDPDSYHQKAVRVSGTVRRACAKKGCWMELAASSDEHAPGCRVTFKDYGFLVPTDSAGSLAEVDAVVQVTRVKPEAVAHYEAEGARFPQKEADGSAREVRLVATGVELSRKRGGG